jgi:molybdate transport system substrate-binding protein
MWRTSFALGLLWLIGSAASLPAAEVPPPQILVFAAASLTDAVQEIAAGYQQSAHVTVKSSFDSSSVLARQIEAGARADVFFPADTAWMDYLQSRQLIQPASRRNVLGNTLVLIAPAQSRLQLKIAPHFPLAAALGDGHLAIGDPDSVPAGRYARSALTALGVWEQVAPRLARAEDVRVALLYVDRGEAPLGIVYGSDARAARSVRVVDTFPADTHEAIVYPIALTATAQGQATGFVAYLTGPPGRDIFVKYGFTVLER